MASRRAATGNNVVECEGSGGFPAWATLMSESLKTLGRPGVPKMATWDSRGAGGLALAQDLKVCGAARDAVNVGLSLDPHRLPLPRPNNNGPEAIRSRPRGPSASAPAARVEILPAASHGPSQATATASTSWTGMIPPPLGVA